MLPGQLVAIEVRVGLGGGDAVESVCQLRSRRLVVSVILSMYGGVFCPEWFRLAQVGVHMGISRGCIYHGYHGRGFMQRNPTLTHIRNSLPLDYKLSHC